MKKVGRNDPCPCGSGKKYKKCRGATNVIALAPTRYNDELNQLHNGLVDFTFMEFEPVINEIIRKSPHYGKEDSDYNIQLYTHLLSAWAVLHYKVHKDDTIFDLYYKKQKNKIRYESVKKTFASWRKVLPSVYRVLEVTEDGLRVQDIRTDEEHKVVIREEHNFETGNLVIGILLPFVQQHEFLMAVFELHDPGNEISEHMKSLKEFELRDHFPEILQEVLTLESNPPELEWEIKIYEDVAELFTKHMHEKGAQDILLFIGKVIWKRFTDEAIPVVRKPEAYAAAVEYVVQRSLYGEPMQSQIEIAEEYGTSSGSVSKHSRTITEVLGDEIEMILDTIFDKESKLKEEQPSSPPSGKDPLLMSEKALQDFHQAIGDRTFESQEELEQFLEELTENPELMQAEPTSPRDMAQNLLYEAYKATGSNRKELIEEALAIYPNSPDAYLLLAEDTDHELKKHNYYMEAVIAGRKDLGAEFFQENKGHFWMITETRPFMRALEALANFEYYLGNTEKAIEHYEELLELNMNDSQGVRYFLPTLYLEAEHYDDAERLLDRYADDDSAAFLFNRVLLRFFKDGLTEETRVSLKEAHEQNPNVKRYLTGEKDFPKEPPASISFGDESEAIAYVQENIHLWLRAKPLLEELAKMR